MGEFIDFPLLLLILTLKILDNFILERKDLLSWFSLSPKDQFLFDLILEGHYRPIKAVLPWWLSTKSHLKALRWYLTSPYLISLFLLLLLLLLLLYCISYLSELLFSLLNQFSFPITWWSCCFKNRYWWTLFLDRG